MTTSPDTIILVQSEPVESVIETLSSTFSNLESETLTDYWALVKDVWTYGIGGTSLGDILIALGILLVFLIFLCLASGQPYY